MKSRLRFALLLPLAALLGCAVPANPSNPSSTTGNWTNWQIQAGTAITSPPTGLYFVGAVQTQASQAAAVFATPGTGQPTPTTLNIVLDFLGTYDSSTGDIALYPATTGSPAYGIGFTAPSTNTTIPVSIVGGCVYPLSYTGVECNALANLSPAVGVEIAPLNGTYTGTLTDTSAPSMSGTGSLTLTQSSTPNSSGAFPLTGTITFPAGSNLGNYPLTGTVSGAGITLNYCSAAVIGPCVNLAASTNPAGIQITISNLTYSQTSSGPAPTFTGTLTLQ